MSEELYPRWGTRIRQAIGGGIAGTTVMLTLLAFFEVQTRSQIGFFEAVARFVGTPTQPVFGVILFAFAGIVVWPVLFVGVEPHLARSQDSRVRSLVFAGVLWIGFLMIGTDSVPPSATVLYAALMLITYLVYGLVFGEVYTRGLRSE